MAVLGEKPMAVDTADPLARKPSLSRCGLTDVVGQCWATTRSPSRRPIDHTGRVLTFQIDERRCLRLLEEADADELYTVVDANREFLAGWMPCAADQTLEGTVEFIRTSRKQLADNQGFQVAIIEDGGIVGVLGFHRLDWENRSTSLGYWIAESSQGHGTVTRAVHALADHAVRTWKLNRVEIRAGVDNARSRAIPTRLGFREEGVLRQAERVGDRFVDHVVYAMLAADWNAAQAELR
jgi:ribosomal-protein-serine acetyltransferase